MSALVDGDGASAAVAGEEAPGAHPAAEAHDHDDHSHGGDDELELSLDEFNSIAAELHERWETDSTGSKLAACTIQEYSLIDWSLETEEERAASKRAAADLDHLTVPEVGKEIRLGRATYRAPNGTAFTVRQLLDVIAASEVEARSRSGGPSDRRFFEGVSIGMYAGMMGRGSVHWSTRRS